MKKAFIGSLISFGVVVLSLGTASAQIRLIPQERLDSVKNPPVATSSLQFPKAPLQMGEIAEESGLWSCEFTWHNGGEATPVVITGVQSSCGCLRAEYGREPVKRGEEGQIRVIYNPKGRPGAVEQRLFVYTNLSASKPSAIVRLQGQVRPAADKRGRYPKAFGALLLRRTEVWLPEGEREVRIACLNGGDGELRITADRLLTPQGITLRSEPEVLGPGAEGDLVIRVAEGIARGSYPVLLEGVSLPPRMRTLRLHYGEKEE